MEDTQICKVNACGLSCPQPAVLAQKAMKENADMEVEVLVDSTAAYENVIRTSQRSGKDVSSKNLKDGTIKIFIR